MLILPPDSSALFRKNIYKYWFNNLALSRSTIVVIYYMYNRIRIGHYYLPSYAVLELGGAQRGGTPLSYIFYFCATQLIFLTLGGGRGCGGVESTSDIIFLKI